jgi:hypothetical protein
MTSPFELGAESISIKDFYPTLERFEEILAEAAYLAKRQEYKDFCKEIADRYSVHGRHTKLTQVERLRLRQLSTGAIS